MKKTTSSLKSNELFQEKSPKQSTIERILLFSKIYQTQNFRLNFN